MSKEKAVHFLLSALAALAPVIVSSFPGLPPLLVSLLALVATFKGGAFLLASTPPAKE